jgi:hypothetical protein
MSYSNYNTYLANRAICCCNSGGGGSGATGPAGCNWSNGTYIVSGSGTSWTVNQSNNVPSAIAMKTYAIIPTAFELTFTPSTLNTSYYNSSTRLKDFFCIQHTLLVPLMHMILRVSLTYFKSSSTPGRCTDRCAADHWRAWPQKTARVRTPPGSCSPSCESRISPCLPHFLGTGRFQVVRW